MRWQIAQLGSRKRESVEEYTEGVQENESEEEDCLDPLNADGDGTAGRAKTASAW